MGGNSMPAGPYAHEVVRLFNKKGRWPAATDIVLPDPPPNGLVQAVTLEPDGVLVLTLPRRVWLQRVRVKVAVLLRPASGGFGANWVCVGVSPGAMAGVIYQHCGRTSMDEVAENRQRAIAFAEEQSG